MTWLPGSSWGLFRITALAKRQLSPAGGAWSFRPGQKWAGPHTDLTFLLITSLALSEDDKRPLLLTLTSPRGGDTVPRSHWLCVLACASVTLGNRVEGCYTGCQVGCRVTSGPAGPREKEWRD